MQDLSGASPLHLLGEELRVEGFASVLRGRVHARAQPPPQRAQRPSRSAAVQKPSELCGAQRAAAAGVEAS